MLNRSHILSTTNRIFTCFTYWKIRRKQW